MTSLTITPSSGLDFASETSRRRALPLVIGAFVAAVALGLLMPDRTVGDTMGMVSTHYMGLLAVNQPWNLLLFMGLPVVLAETLAITELVLLLNRAAPRWVRTLSRAAGLIAGPVMALILVHLVRYAVLPLSEGGGWRGMADVIAVFAYLAGAIPLIMITLVEAGVLGRDDESARRLHVIGVAAFLVVAHVAMIFGMMDPTVLGWTDPAATHVMTDGSSMPGMSH